jgi:hypothetical protein
MGMIIYRMGMIGNGNGWNRNDNLGMIQNGNGTEWEWYRMGMVGMGMIHNVT